MACDFTAVVCLSCSEENAFAVACDFTAVVCLSCSEENAFAVACDFTAVVCFAGINPRQGVNVFLHGGIALLMCFGILTTCTIGVNLIHRNCAKPMH